MMCIKLVGGGYQNKGLYVESMMTKLREGYKANPRNMSDNMKMVALISTYMDKVWLACFSFSEPTNLCVFFRRSQLFNDQVFSLKTCTLTK